MSTISTQSEFSLKELRECHKTAKTNPNDDLFTQEPGAFELCKKGEEGALFLFFDDFKEEACDNPNYVLTASTFTIDGKDTVFNKPKEIQKFIEENYKEIYNNAMDLKIKSHFVLRSQDPSEADIAIYNEYQEFTKFLTTTYGECESNHTDL